MVVPVGASSSLECSICGIILTKYVLRKLQLLVDLMISRVLPCSSCLSLFSEREAKVMKANSWLYHYYMVQSRLQYSLAYGGQSPTSALAAAAFYPGAPPGAPGHPGIPGPYSPNSAAAAAGYEAAAASAFHGSAAASFLRYAH